jgi:hypothetical protein
MSAVVYDAAVLVAADRSDRRAWAEHRVRLEDGTVPLVPAAVLSQVSRSGRQAELRRFLRGCVVVPLDEVGAHEIGRLLGAARTADVADACVVTVARAARAATIVTGDPRDIEHLAGVAGIRPTIVVL